MNAEAEYPSSDYICQLVISLVETIPAIATYGNHEYDDGRIRTVFNPNRRPNITVSIIRGRERIPVFEAQRNEPSYPIRYNPGHWIQYLEKLVEEREAETRESFSPVDDRDLFPE